MDSLYNEKMETLISAALMDGVLTEKEKQVLFKKAQEQGIDLDLDEFEMVLNARLAKLQKAKQEKAAKKGSIATIDTQLSNLEAHLTMLQEKKLEQSQSKEKIVSLVMKFIGLCLIVAGIVAFISLLDWPWWAILLISLIYSCIVIYLCWTPIRWAKDKNDEIEKDIIKTKEKIIELHLKREELI